MTTPNQHGDIKSQARLDRIHQIVNDCLVRRTAGESISDDSIIAAHPDLMPQLEEWLHGLHLIRAVVEQSHSGVELHGHGHFGCPYCDTEVIVNDDIPPVCPSCGSPLGAATDTTSSASLSALLVECAPEELPTYIGRYRIEKLLGKGGFGRVYLGHDDQLERPVAVKVPHAKLVATPEQAEAYATEARIVAKLDHSHIVPVYDVGSTSEFPCYMVCKYIEGCDLATRAK